MDVTGDFMVYIRFCAARLLLLEENKKSNCWVSKVYSHAESYYGNYSVLRGNLGTGRCKVHSECSTSGK